MNTCYHCLVAALAKHAGLVSILGLIALSTGCTTMVIPHKKTHVNMTVLSKRIVTSLFVVADVVKNFHRPNPASYTSDVSLQS